MASSDYPPVSIVGEARSFQPTIEVTSTQLREKPPVRFALVLATASLLAAGCGGESFPETYPVTGVVTFKGKPLEGADVQLIPTDPAVRSAGGTTDAEGKFSVKTYFDPQNQSEGAMRGEYAVTITKVEAAKIPEGMKPEEMMAYHMKRGAPKSLLPAKYKAPNTSGFKVSVGETPPEPLQLDLN